MTSSNKNQKSKAKMLLVLPIAMAMFFLFAFINGQNLPELNNAKINSNNLLAVKSVTLKTTNNVSPKDSLKPKKKKVMAVSPTKMNVLYLGADNPVSIAVSDVSPEKLNVTVSNGTIINAKADQSQPNYDGQYIIRPKQVGMEILTIFNGKEKIGIMEFRVKNVPDPVAKVAGLKGGTINKTELIQQKIVQADMEGFDFDLQFTVTEFTLSYANNGYVNNYVSKSNKITDEQKALFEKLNSGDNIYFQDIKCIGPDGKIRGLSALYFKIQ
jgi:hypothetical protein